MDSLLFLSGGSGDLLSVIIVANHAFLRYSLEKQTFSYGVCQPQATTDLLGRFRVDSSFLFIGKQTFPFTSGIPARPPQFASPPLLWRFELLFVPAAGFRLDSSLLLRFLLLLFVALHLDILRPFQCRFPGFLTFCGEGLCIFPSSFRFFPLGTKAINL